MTNPYATYADSTEVVSNYFQTQLRANVSQFTDGDGNAVQDVWYGDVSGLIPHTPCICVIPGSERSSYNGAGGRPVMMVFLTFVMVYCAFLADQQTNVHGSLTIANKVKRFIHADITLGQNVIDSLCTAVEPGVAVRGQGLFDATRITFQSRAKTVLNP